jgi:hypothetical protein
MPRDFLQQTSRERNTDIPKRGLAGQNIVTVVAESKELLVVETMDWNRVSERHHKLRV